MARLTKAERAELEAKLRADDDADDDDEVELTFTDGSRFRGTFRRARSVASARGFKLDPDPPADDGKDDGKDDGPKGNRFAGRRVG